MEPQSVRIAQRRFSSIIDSILNNDIQHLNVNQTPKVTCKSPTHVSILHPVVDGRLYVCFEVEKDDLNSIYKAYEIKSDDIECLDATFIGDDGRVNLLFDIKYTNCNPLKIFKDANSVLIDIFNILLSATQGLIKVTDNGCYLNKLVKVCEKDIRFEEYFYISKNMIKRLPSKIIELSKSKDFPKIDNSGSGWWEEYIACFSETQPGDEIRPENQEWAEFLHYLKQVIKSLTNVGIQVEPALLGVVLRATKDDTNKCLVEKMVNRIVCAEIGIREFDSLYSIFSDDIDSIFNLTRNINSFTSAFMSHNRYAEYPEESNMRGRSRVDSLEDFRNEQRGSSRSRSNRR